MEIRDFSIWKIARERVELFGRKRKERESVEKAAKLGKLEI